MQPTHASKRILLPVKPWFIAASLLAALFFAWLPMGPVVFLPDWAALVLAFWCIHQPFKVGMGIGFLMGLAMDVAEGSILGQHALAYVVLAFLANGWSRRVLWFSLPGQAAHVFLLLLLAQAAQLLLRLAVGGDFPGLAYFLSSAVAALLWHPLSYLLLLPQYRPIERDETRPI
ncbi:MAG: rod shape-determining protein MreD [Rhodocyclaceae bacterium]|nr:rod shape-determining protein MreD [Rhodocyclaceae bacterium]